MKFRAFLLVLCACFQIALLAQVPVAIRTDNVKARKAPNTNAQVLATLHKDETFIIQSDQPYWYEIILRNGKHAFVRKSSCTVLPQEDTPDGDAETPQPPPAVPAPQADPACHVVTVPADWNVCPASGSGGMYAEAYKQKNRLSTACAYSPMTVDDVLALKPLPKAVRALPDNDPQAQYLKQTESQTVTVEGYLAMAKDGGKEGVNCGSSTRLDTHMELVDTDAADPKTNRSHHVIAEVTPWFHADVPEWTTASLGTYASYVNGYSGSNQGAPKRIRVSGYLFFDEAHATGAESWRGTAWEVHPITKIEIFENGAWKQIGTVQ